MIERVKDPSTTQTADEITDYYRNAAVGDEGCIRTTYAGFLEFKMSVIEKAAHKSRLALRDMPGYGGYGFYVDGRNCRSPQGQARLVKPTSEIKEWLTAHPHGVRDWY